MEYLFLLNEYADIQTLWFFRFMTFKGNLVCVWGGIYPIGYISKDPFPQTGYPRKSTYL